MQVFNIDSGDVPGTGDRRYMPIAHLDAAENIFFQRELEQMLTEQFDVKRIPLRSKLFVPMRPGIDPGAETVGYEGSDWLGAAKEISDFSDDVPNVNVKGQQNFVPMRSYGVGCNFSLGEIRAAAKAGRPLERMRLDACRKAMDLKLDDILATGDTGRGLYGLLNQASAATVTPVAKTGGGTTWSTASADEILTDLYAMVDKINVDSAGAERCNQIILPLAAYRIAARKRLDASVSDTTVLEFFKSQNPGVSVDEWERCNSVSSDTRAVAYAKEILNVHALMAVEFETLAPQVKNFATKVLCHMRTGGVVSPYPKSIVYCSGI